METQWEPKTNLKRKRKGLSFFLFFGGCWCWYSLICPVCNKKNTRKKDIYMSKELLLRNTSHLGTVGSSSHVFYTTRPGHSTQHAAYRRYLWRVPDRMLYALSIKHSHNTGAMLLRVGRVIIIFYRRREQVRSVGSGRCEMKRKGSDSCCCSSFTTCRTY
jgi:hypothetical protein